MVGCSFQQKSDSDDRYPTSQHLSRMTRVGQFVAKATFRQTSVPINGVLFLTKELSKVEKNEIYSMSIVKLFATNCYNGKITKAIDDEVHIEFPNFHGVFKRPEGVDKERFKIGTKVHMTTTLIYDGPSSEFKIESANIKLEEDSVNADSLDSWKAELKAEEV